MARKVLVTIKKGKIMGKIIGIGILAFLAVVGIWWVQTKNDFVGITNLIHAAQKDNISQMDNMTKKIIQSAKVTDMQAKAVVDVMKGYTEGRGKNNGSLLTAVHEAVPNLDQSTFQNLMNIVNASRDSFTFKQTYLLDLKRRHDDMRTKFPSSLVCGNTPEIEVKIVTSTRAENAFETQKDDDTDLIPKR